MKRIALPWMVVTLAFAPVAPCAEQAPDPEKVLAETQQKSAELRKALEDKINAVDAAIATASKAGTLKTSTEAYFRDALDRFRPETNILSGLERQYYPPRFDTSAEMEPINLAWADLREEVSRVKEESFRVSIRLLNAAGEALDAAAQAAEKPEDLDPAEKLIAAYQQQEDFTRSRPYPGQPSASDTLARMAASFRDALNARQKQDAGRLAVALQRMNPNPNYSGVPPNLQNSTFRPDITMQEFRTRMIAPQVQAAKEAQQELEKQLMERKPAAEIGRAMSVYETNAAQLDKVVRDPRQPFSYGSDQTPQSTYRSAAQALAALQDGSELNRVRDLGSISDPSNTISAEFRTFLSNLSKEVEERKRQAQMTAEAERRTQTEQAELQRRQKEAEKVAREQQEALARVAKANDTIRQKLAGIRTAQQALAAADELPRLGLSPDAQRTRDDMNSWQQIQMLQQELRQLAAWWLDGEPPASASAYDRSGIDRSGIDRSGAHGFVAEMRTLRDRALREVIANRFNALELMQPEFEAMNARAAVEALAKRAADSGEWKRSLDLVQAVSPQSRTLSERAQAIRAYLTGRNYEQAEQFIEAIIAYQSVLQQVADHTPITEAGERLKALRTSNPAAFEEAAQRAPAKPLPTVRPEFAPR